MVDFNIEISLVYFLNSVLAKPTFALTTIISIYRFYFSVPVEKILLKFLIAGTSYFPLYEYHRIQTLLLLCSEWEEVEHV